MNKFWESLSLPWQVCLEESWMAYCAGSVPIGAAITAADGTLVARGRNRITAPPAGDGSIGVHQLAHAEVNALLALDFAAIDIHSCILYTTTEPCPLCMGAIYMSGLRRCHYASRDPWAGSANMIGATTYLSRKPVCALGPERADLELAVITVFIEYSLEKQKELNHPIFTEIEKMLPETIRLGRKLFQIGLLQRMRQEVCPAQQAWGEVLRFASSKHLS